MSSFRKGRSIFPIDELKERQAQLEFERLNKESDFKGDDFTNGIIHMRFLGMVVKRPEGFSFPFVTDVS